MQISVGDEGGTAARLLAPPFSGAHTTKAAQRPSLTFTETDFAAERDPELDRSKLKKELTQSMTIAEAKKQRAAAIKKKIQDDYQKNRDPIKEFFQLVSVVTPINFLNRPANR